MDSNHNPGLLSALTDYNSSGADSPSDMGGPNSPADAPAAKTRPSPTEIPPRESGPPTSSALTTEVTVGWQPGVALRLPLAAVGNVQPEADFLKCKSGPKWHCEESGSRVGTPESTGSLRLRLRLSIPSQADAFKFAVARTSHWRHTAFGIPKQTSIAGASAAAS
jgi:hypothetical protein